MITGGVGEAGGGKRVRTVCSSIKINWGEVDVS